MRRLWLGLWPGLWLAVPLAGCTAAAPPPAECAVGAPAITAQLLFGRSIPGGGPVDAAAWQGFLDQAVTPRFPDGLTVLDGSGQWRRRDTGRIGSEPSTVMIIVGDDRPETYARLDAVRAEYRRRFHQESVGLVVNRACAAF